MYEELIRRLREEPLDSNKAALPIMDLCIDAATAIENLSHRLDMAQGERDAVTRHMIDLEQEVCRLKSRLSAYEDTGLEPEEIKRIVDAYGRGHTMRTESTERLEIVREIKTDRLRELVQAEQDGRLVVLPCKVGDTIYVIGESCDFCETYLDEPERCMRCEKGHYVEERGFELWMLSELNESIFLTREEAEAALAGEGGDS